MAKNIKFCNLNVHHSPTVMDSLSHAALDKALDVISLNEVYVKEGSILVPSGYSAVYSARPHFRAALRVSQRINYCAVAQDRDVVAIRASLREGSLLIVSCYCAPSEELKRNLLGVEKVLRKYRKDPVVLVGDFNAKSYLWGDRPTDQRGKVLISFASNAHLDIENDTDNLLTYSSRTGDSWIAILLTRRCSWRIEDWEISDSERLTRQCTGPARLVPLHGILLTSAPTGVGRNWTGRSPFGPCVKQTLPMTIIAPQIKVLNV